MGEVAAYFGADQQLGIHTQNDTGCAVANSVAAVVAGATHVQGTVNGYGERTGNANLMTVVPDLQLKMGVACLPEGRIERLTAVSRHVAELVNLPPHAADPYVGASAFAHKGGLHTSALGKIGGASYEHVDPAVVGNHTRVLVSDLGGRAGMALKAGEFGVDLDDRAAAELSERLKHLEAEGYQFEAADASLELLMREASGLGAAVLPARGLPGHHATTGTHCAVARRSRTASRSSTPRPRSRCGSATSGSWPSARATARSTRSTPRCARC